jgi:transcriptional regulator with XRE-family HTH domain
MDVRRQLGLNVKRFRIAAGMSQDELVQRMGVDQGYVSGLEVGRQNPTVLTVWHAAVALGTTPSRLLEEAPPCWKPRPQDVPSLHALLADNMRLL